MTSNRDHCIALSGAQHVSPNRDGELTADWLWLTRSSVHAAQEEEQAAQREAEELAAADAAEAAQEAEAARVSAEAAAKEAALEEQAEAATQQQASYAGVVLAGSAAAVAATTTVDDADDMELVEQEDAMLVEAESPEAESAADHSPRAEAFSGLFYCDGMDTQGKPVVVIDTDYLPPTKAQRQAAADWLKEAMAPAVEAGEYSIVILGSRRTRASSWDSWWMAQQYKSLARPVRKNVQLLVWVNPTSVTKVRSLCSGPLANSTLSD